MPKRTKKKPDMPDVTIVPEGKDFDTMLFLALNTPPIKKKAPKSPKKKAAKQAEKPDDKEKDAE
ncbi:hypothetical protein [Chitinophaga sp. CB10]|uniref:hypothetical protein n=1 Tax=Chitinophaga sp. CB10 TaxID=1891659 RepID=UPI0025BC9550|nr:hypothetical protein [Chitinophaga sp. CB10]